MKLYQCMSFHHVEHYNLFPLSHSHSCIIFSGDMISERWDVTKCYFCQPNYIFNFISWYVVLPPMSSQTIQVVHVLCISSWNAIVLILHMVNFNGIFGILSLQWFNISLEELVNFNFKHSQWFEACTIFLKQGFVICKTWTCECFR